MIYNVLIVIMILILILFKKVVVLARLVNSLILIPIIVKIKIII